jgi:2-polyprenyl-3-methyl-5-hydroxy-6-metoxy-1,4-benzoquinol methylase
MPVEHSWSEPRKQIQFFFADNDIGYITHANFISGLLLWIINKTPKELNKMKLLEYGCGTGAQGRNLSFYFDKVISYDTSPQCIEEGRKEYNQCKKTMDYKRNWSITDNIYEVKEYKFDIIYTINVFEHLNLDQGNEAMKNIDSALKDNGKAIIFYNRFNPDNINCLNKWINKDLTKFDEKLLGYYNKKSIDEINDSKSTICMNIYQKGMKNA